MFDYESPPPEIPAGWDPVAAWLPPPPATPAADPRAAPLPPSAGTSAPCSDKPRSGLAAAWGRLKRRLSGGGRAAQSGGSRSGTGAAVPAALHTTGSLPLPLPEPQPVRPSAPVPAPAPAGGGTGRGKGARILTPPSLQAGDPQSSRPGSRDVGGGSIPGSSEQLLRITFEDGQTGGPGDPPDSADVAAPGGGGRGQHRPQKGPGWQHLSSAPSSAPRPEGSEGHTARRLVFSPAAAGDSEGWAAPPQHPFPWPTNAGVRLADSRRQQQSGGASRGGMQHRQQAQQAERQRRSSLDMMLAQRAQQAENWGWQPAANGGLPHGGSLPIDVPAGPSGSLAGTGDGPGSASALYGIPPPQTGAPGDAASRRAARNGSRASLDVSALSRSGRPALDPPAPPRRTRASLDIAALPSRPTVSLASLAGSLLMPAAVQQLLGSAVLTGLAGRWVRDGGEEGPAATASAAAIDALLQLPPLVAAARESTRELEARCCARPVPRPACRSGPCMRRKALFLPGASAAQRRRFACFLVAPLSTRAPGLPRVPATWQWPSAARKAQHTAFSASLQPPQITESEDELALEWTAHLAGGARIASQPVAHPKSGALAEVPRMDGRQGGASAQVHPRDDFSVAGACASGASLRWGVARGIIRAACTSRAKLAPSAFPCHPHIGLSSGQGSLLLPPAQPATLAATRIPQA